VEKEIKNSKGEIERLEASLITEKQENVPGVIHWVSEKHSIRAEVRHYNKLFLEEDPKVLGEKWKECINKNSLVVLDKALIWNTLKDVKELDRFQFERKGYFSVDYDTDIAKNRYVFNLIVTLSENKDKKKGKEIKKRKLKLHNSNY